MLNPCTTYIINEIYLATTNIILPFESQISKTQRMLKLECHHTDEEELSESDKKSIVPHNVV